VYGVCGAGSHDLLLKWCRRAPEAYRGGQEWAGLGDPDGGWLALADADGLPNGDAGVDGGGETGTEGTEAGGRPLVTGLPVGCPAVTPGDACEVLGWGLAELEGPDETEGPVEGCVDAAPDGLALSVADGVAEDRSGSVACRAGGGEVDTPGCRIGAIGGCLGSGSGVRPDTHA
jgi:hypothetical protein